MPFRNPVKIAARRAVHLDLLATYDDLFSSAARTMMASNCFTVPALDYLTRKRRAIRAGYFRQRYGRDYYAERNMPPAAVRA